MKHIYLLFLLIFALKLSLFAQNQGAENGALGVTGIATQNLFSIYSNPANLAQIDSTQIGVTAKQIAWLGKALESGIQFATPVKNIHAGAGIYNFGNSFYNFGQINFSLAKALDKKQGIGISVNYFREFIYLNSNENALNASIGYYYQATPKLRLGAKVQQVFYRSDERLERSYSQVSSQGGIGLQFAATESLILNAEVVADELNALRVGTGVKLLKNKYALLLGLSSHESLVNAGISLPLNAFTFNLTYGYHQRLGSALQTSLIYQW